jgi:hypothetical protein
LPSFEQKGWLDFETDWRVIVTWFTAILQLSVWNTGQLSNYQMLY